MDNEMKLPKYYDLVRLVAQVGAVLGCVAGAVAILGSFGAFTYGFMAGMTAIFGGLVTIVLSLAALGATYCFLSIVEAQVDTRNAIINYVESKQRG